MDSLVSTEWLANEMGASDLRIVDATKFLPDHGRNALAEYEAGHIPGAVFIDWTKDIVDPDAPVKAQIAPPERFGACMAAIGIGDQFEHLHDIVACDLRPKPQRHGYELLCARMGIDPARACMVEDMAQNLAPAKQLGMTTVWVDNGSERGNYGHHPSFIDLTIRDVGEWLEEMTGKDEPAS